MLTKLLASPVAKSAVTASVAAKPASPWADLKAAPESNAAVGSFGAAVAANQLADDQPPAASPAAEPVRGADAVLQPSSVQPSPATAAISPAQSDLTPSARAAIAAKVGSGRRLLPVRSPAGRQVSMGEALHRAARGAPATARRLEDSFAVSSAAAPSDDAVAPPPADDASTRAGQQAPAGGDVVLPSYLQAALAAADSSSVPGTQMLQNGAADAQQPVVAAPALSRSKLAQMQASQRDVSEVERLPPVSQLDASVLDALPLHLKRELEMAYGVHWVAL